MISELVYQAIVCEFDPHKVLNLSCDKHFRYPTSNCLMIRELVYRVIICEFDPHLVHHAFSFVQHLS